MSYFRPPPLGVFFFFLAGLEAAEPGRFFFLFLLLRDALEAPFFFALRSRSFHLNSSGFP